MPVWNLNRKPTKGSLIEKPSPQLVVDLGCIRDDAMRFQIQDSYPLIPYLPVAHRQELFDQVYRYLEDNDSLVEQGVGAVINQVKRTSTNLYLHMPHNPLHRSLIGSVSKLNTDYMEVLSGESSKDSWVFEEAERQMLSDWLTEHEQPIWDYRRDHATGQAHDSDLPDRFATLIEDIRYHQRRISRLQAIER